MRAPETDDLALLIDAARGAGEIAMRHFRRAPEVWEKDAGQGPVTQADLEVNAMLEAELAAARPGYGWLSEETEDTPARLERDLTFIVDPIDGTRAFIEEKDAFGHALAIADRGEIVAGVMYLPARGELYAAARGHGATLNGAAIRTSTRDALTGAKVAAPRNQLKPEYWPGGVPDIVHTMRPALAWRLCLAADGSLDGMFTFRPVWEWDAAAGSLIASEAGAAVTDGAGRTPRFNSDTRRLDGIIAAPAPLTAEIIARRGVGAPAS